MDNKFIAAVFGKETMPGIDADAMRGILSVVEKCKGMDPRLQHIYFLEKMLCLVEQVRGELARVQNEDVKIKRASDFAASYSQKASEDFERESLRQKLAVSFAPAMTFVIGAAMTAVIGKAGEVAVLRAFATLE